MRLFTSAGLVLALLLWVPHARGADGPEADQVEVPPTPMAQAAPPTEEPAATTPKPDGGKEARPTLAEKHTELRKKAEELRELLGPSETAIARHVQASLLDTEELLGKVDREHEPLALCLDLGFYLGRMDRAPVEWQGYAAKLRVLKDKPEAHGLADFVQLTTQALHDALTALKVQCHGVPEKAALRRKLVDALRLQLSLYRRLASDTLADQFLQGLVAYQEVTEAEAAVLRRAVSAEELASRPH